MVPAALALLFWARLALAHTPGLSVADFEVQPGGLVEARVTFASTEALGGPFLGRDHNGLVSPEDVAAAQEDLRAFALQGIGVEADGSPCSPAFRSASLTEVDGLVLEVSYACPDDASEIQATLYYLSALPRGVAHKGVARIVAGGATHEAVLSGERRALSLRLPRQADAAAREEARLVALAAAGVVGLVLACRSHVWTLVVRTWRLLRQMG